MMCLVKDGSVQNNQNTDLVLVCFALQQCHLCILRLLSQGLLFIFVRS